MIQRVHLPKRTTKALTQRGQLAIRATSGRVLILELEGALADLRGAPTLNAWGDEANTWRTHLPRWTQLRTDLGRAHDDAYAEARTWADAKQGASLETRALLSFAFDAEPYADALLRDAHARQVRPAVLTLAFASARDVRLIAEVGAWVAAKHPTVALERAGDLLDRFASDAAALETIFLAWLQQAEATKAASDARVPQGFIDALACIGTPKAAEKMVLTLGTTKGKLLATRYFKRFPDLAPAALAPLVKKRGKVGDTAKVLLETFVAASANPVPEAHPNARREGTTEGPEILRNPPWRNWSTSGFLVIDEPPTPNFALPPEAAAKHDRHAWVAKLPSLPLGSVTTSGAAFIVARCWQTKKTERAAAETWLQTFAPIAAYGLLTFVVGPPGASRTTATAALRLVWKTLGEDRGGKIVARWCEDTRQPEAIVVPSVKAILNAHPRWECPSSAPAVPAFVVLSALPELRTRSGELLSEKARKHLVEMMIFAGAAQDESASENVYVGVHEVREALSASSLDAFSWAIAETWSAVGVRTKTSWPLHQLSFFGGPYAAQRLNTQIRAMATEALVERALTATSVLARFNTPSAHLHLAALEHTKNERVRERVREELLQAAGARGLSLHAWMDELVPDCSDDVIAIDGQHVRIRLGADLKPQLVDDAGTLVAKLPRASTEEDEEARCAFALRYETRVAEAESAAKAQIKRLELAMCVGASWSLERFQARIVAQPFLRHLGIGILWSASTMSGTRTLFRIAEDGSFADVLDAHLHIDPSAVIRIPHALELSAEERAHWGQVWAEYQLTQPFDQLGRETFRLAPHEVGSATLTRLIGLRGQSALFFALEQRGWSILGARSEVYGAEKARLRFTLRVPVDLVHPKQTPTFDVAHAGFIEGEPRTWSDIEISELLRDLAPLTR